MNSDSEGSAVNRPLSIRPRSKPSNAPTAARSTPHRVGKAWVEPSLLVQHGVGRADRTKPSWQPDPAAPAQQSLSKSPCSRQALGTCVQCSGAAAEHFGSAEPRAMGLLVCDHSRSSMLSHCWPLPPAQATSLKRNCPSAARCCSSSPSALYCGLVGLSELTERHSACGSTAGAVCRKASFHERDTLRCTRGGGSSVAWSELMAQRLCPVQVRLAGCQTKYAHAASRSHSASQSGSACSGSASAEGQSGPRLSTAASMSSHSRPTAIALNTDRDRVRVHVELPPSHGGDALPPKNRASCVCVSYRPISQNSSVDLASVRPVDVHDSCGPGASSHSIPEWPFPARPTVPSYVRAPTHRSAWL